MFMDRFGEWAENHPRFFQFLLESGCYGDRIENRIYSYTGKHLLFFKRNAQLFVGFQQLRVHLV